MGHDARWRRQVANRQAAHLHRRGEIAVDERRRCTQHVGHVVEARGRAVYGKKRRRVDPRDRAGHGSHWHTRSGSAGEAWAIPDWGRWRQHDPVRPRAMMPNHPGLDVSAGALPLEASGRCGSCERQIPRPRHPDPTISASFVSRARPAVFAVELWQVRQYRSRSPCARSRENSVGTAASGVVCTGAAARVTAYGPSANSAAATHAGRIFPVNAVSLE